MIKRHSKSHNIRILSSSSIKKKRLKISQTEQSVPGRGTHKTKRKEEQENVAAVKVGKECKMAGWDNGNMPYMNNDNTRKAGRGPDGKG